MSKINHSLNKESVVFSLNCVNSTQTISNNFLHLKFLVFKMSMFHYSFNFRYGGINPLGKSINDLAKKLSSKDDLNRVNTIIILLPSNYGESFDDAT